MSAIKTQEQIEDTTGLLLLVIAETVMESKPVHLQTEHNYMLLVNKAVSLFNNNKTFVAKLMQKGNKGRDALYMYMNHWSDLIALENHRSIKLFFNGK